MSWQDSTTDQIMADMRRSALAVDRPPLLLTRRQYELLLSELTVDELERYCHRAGFDSYAVI